MQQTDFDFEVVIGEDCSTDNTRKICEKYANRYPSVKLLESKKNLGLVKNWKRVLTHCTGEYIAMCEGDDYWTDPLKLQRQVDFLDKNPDFTLCFHNRNYQKGDYISDELHCNYGKETHFVHEEILNARIHTLTVVFRNILKEKPVPDVFFTLPLIDNVVWTHLSRFGKAAYLDFVGATYRLHENGVYSAGDIVSNLEKWIVCQLLMKKHFPQSYKKSFSDIILMVNHMLLEELWNKKLLPKYSLNMVKLIVRSVQFGNDQYTKYYYSFFKTKFKLGLKRILGIKQKVNK